jgi:tetratricopeptide (TPR) repeat protein
VRIAVALLLAFIFSSVSVPAADLSAPFESANKLYEEGKYADAIAAYDKLLGTGAASAALYFNRGNAYFKLGQLGRAIDSYRHARQFAPRDPDLRANLQVARTHARGGAPYHTERWRAWLGMLTLNEWTVLAAAVFWLLFLLLALGQWRKELARSLRKFIVAAIVAVLFLGACFAASFTADYLTQSAIVVAGESEVRNGPLDESPALYKVRDGIELNVLDRLGDWLQVVDSAQRIGWLRQDQVLVFEPAGSRRQKS